MHRLVFLVILAACACNTGGEEMAEQTLTLKASGLYLTANPLDAPPGALAEATNAVIRRRGVIEPRRGQEPDATVPLGAYVDGMASFEGELIVHTSENQLGRRTSDTTITAYSGSYAPPTGEPPRFAEATGSLYATTNEGLVRLDSPEGAWVAAGVPPGLEGGGTVTGTSGWLGYRETVGYRLVWGRRDGDGQLMLGAPSGRILVTNAVQNSTPVAFTWTRAAAVITATNVGHGLNTGDTVVVTTTSDASAVPLAVYTITVTGADTFTFTGVDAGGASGSGEYVGDDPGTRDVAITTPIPEGILLDVHFLQVYRTVLTTSGSADPGEDMAQVGEFFPTPTQLAAGEMTVTDIAPFANGPSAYFNPSLGVGLAGAKLPPPLLSDAVVFNGHLFGVVAEYQQTVSLSLLATDGLVGLGTLDGIELVDFDASVSERFVANNALSEGAVIGPGEWAFKWFAAGTAAQNIEDTARSLVRVINLRSSYFYATYASSPSETPGQIIITRRVVGPTRPVVRAINNGKCWAPALRMYFDATLTRVANVVTASVAGPHPAITFAVDDRVVVYDSTDPDFPDGSKTITSATGSNFTWAEVGPDVAIGVPVTMYTDIPEQEMIGATVPGSYAFSDYEEPDSWPPRYRFQVGGPNATLYRITPQGSALLFWTSQGLFRLTGRTADEFTLLPVDPSVQLIVENSTATIGNRAFGLTTQGLVSVSDLGVEKISEPLDELLLEYYGSTSDRLAILQASAFAYAYESENEYTLFLPEIDALADTPANRAYTYNVQTNTWVGPWEFNWAGINTNGEVRSAHVHAGDGRLYIAAGERLTRERKSRALSDYQDADGVGIPMDVQTVANTAKNPAAYKQWVETTVLLEAPQPASAELYFTTEIDSVEEGVTIETQGNSAIRSYVPLDKSRSARLTVGLRHSTAEEKLTILGYSVVANVSSTRVGR